MMFDDPSDLTPTERGARLVDLLRDGRRLTEADIARELGISRQWANYMMRFRVGRVCPSVRKDETTGEYFYE